MKIDTHTHILPESWPDLRERYGYGGFIKLERIDACSARMMSDEGRFFRTIQDNCWSAERRLEECEAVGVSRQVLSTVPVMFSYWAKGEDALDLSRILNDHIAAVVRQYPGRFSGLGTIPLQDPDLAVGELRRCREQLGLAGVQIGSHVGETNLSDPGLFAVFEAAQDLGALVFVHPWDMMGSDTMNQYWLPWLVGMPAETARAICSMIFGGVFERLPRLSTLFAHGGGSFPATLGRIEHGFHCRPDLVAVDNKKNPRDYLPRIFVDSLVHEESALRYLVDLLGENNIALGSDYPFPLGETVPGSLVESAAFLNVEQKERILSGTANELLGLHP